MVSLPAHLVHDIFPAVAPFAQQQLVMGGICKTGVLRSPMHLLFPVVSKYNMIYTDAILDGNLLAIKMMYKLGVFWGGSYFNAINYAASMGQLKILKWLYANGCLCGANTCACAARNGHLKVLKWLRANGCPWDAITCEQATIFCHFELFKWAVDNGCPWDRLLYEACYYQI